MGTCTMFCGIVLLVLVLFVLVRTRGRIAVEGWQDDSGFHEKET